MQEQGYLFILNIIQKEKGKAQTCNILSTTQFSPLSQSSSHGGDCHELITFTFLLFSAWLAITKKD